LLEAGTAAYQKALALSTGKDRPIATELKAATDFDQFYLAKPGARS